MFRRARNVLVGVALTVLASVAGAALAADQTVPFTVLVAGKSSAIRESTQLVVKNQAAWEALWRRHTGSTDSAAPAVDFARDMVIAIFAGESPATQALSIGRIARGDQSLVVWYALRDTRPPADGENLAKTTPFQIVRTARTSLPVQFSRVKIQQPFRAP